MTRQHSRNRIVIAAALAVLCACAYANAKRPAPAKAKAATAETAAPVGEAVAYEALEHHVGAQILVETTLNTVRRGTLVKYTNPALTLRLGEEHGSIDLTVPRDTVRGVRVLSPAPPTQAEPAGSAKKN
jgi:hypothetical protein